MQAGLCAIFPGALGVGVRLPVLAHGLGVDEKAWGFVVCGRVGAVLSVPLKAPDADRDETDREDGKQPPGVHAGDVGE